jgi:hypothetical protein
LPNQKPIVPKKLRKLAFAGKTYEKVEQASFLGPMIKQRPPQGKEINGKKE